MPDGDTHEELSRAEGPRHEGRVGGTPERSPISRQRARGGGWGLEQQDPEAGPGWHRTRGKGPVALQAKARSEHTKAI